MEFDFETPVDSVVKIKVIGVGGGGNNAVNRMISSNIRGVEFIAINTDRQALKASCAARKLVIGEKITRGLGAGSIPEVGRRAAEDSADDIKEILADTDMVFITAGMGGGTGTGAAPVVARLAHELGILTIGIVTKPFNFEGVTRYRQAEMGIAELSKYVDSLIVIPNERLRQVEGAHITFANAFEIADDVLRRGVQSVSELISVTSYINLDFADVTTIMKDAGYAHMGIGAAKGKDKAEFASMAAISSPLLETNITGATGVLVCITASEDIEFDAVNVASELIRKEADEQANIIWGVNIDPNLHDEIRVTVIATRKQRILDGDTDENITAEEKNENTDSIEEVEASTNEEQIISAIEEVVKENAKEEVQPTATQKPEVIVNTIPSKATAQSTYSDYDDIFSMIKKRKQNS